MDKIAAVSAAQILQKWLRYRENLFEILEILMIKWKYQISRRIPYETH